MDGVSAVSSAMPSAHTTPGRVTARLQSLALSPSALGPADTSFSSAKLDDSTDTVGDVACAGAGSDNFVVEFVRRVEAEEDVHRIMLSLAHLLHNPLTATILPNSQKKVAVHEEIMAVVWKLVDIDQRFFLTLLKSNEILDLVYPLLYYLAQHKHQEELVGLLSSGIYTLLVLSGERNFSVRLNRPFTLPPPPGIPVFVGSHAELLVLVLHDLLLCKNIMLLSLYDVILTIIVNVSPYVKSMSSVGAGRLMHLFEVFATKKFLLANETNHHLVFFLLETANNLIQYQYEGNHHFVYQLLLKRQPLVFLRVLPETVFSDEVASATESSIPVEAEHFTIQRGYSSTFVATKDWLSIWHEKLPFETIGRMLQILAPQVDRVFTNLASKEEAVVDFLKNGTLVGLLPVPHPILIRKYQSQTAGSLWYQAYVWSVIFTKHASPPIFYGSHVKLFHSRLSDT
jgi:hypothetical protein